jgi:hypothetical protein
MRSLILVIAILYSSSLFAAVQAGVGQSSTTSGRWVPGLELGVGHESWLATLSSVGVNNAYYYNSSYTVNVFHTWKAGDLFWGDVDSGFGAGAMYSVRGFEDSGSSQESTASDFVFGPAFFLQWYVAGPVYLKLDMLWGIRSLSALVGLNGQDVSMLSLGVRAW